MFAWCRGPSNSLLRKKCRRGTRLFRSLLYIAQHTEEPSYLVHDTGLLEAMEDGLDQYTLRGTVLRLLLVLAKHPEAQAE